MDIPDLTNMERIDIIPHGHGGALPNMDVLVAATTAFAGRMPVGVTHPGDGLAWLQSAVEGVSRAATGMLSSWTGAAPPPSFFGYVHGLHSQGGRASCRRLLCACVDGCRADITRGWVG